MLRALMISGLLLWLPLVAWALQPGERVDNFQLLDHRGQSHELYYHNHVRALVLMVQGNGCPIVRNQLPRFAEIRAQYAAEGVQFLLINANLQDDRAAILAEAEAFGINLPILIDDAQLVGEALGFIRTAEVFVIDTNGWRLHYRGPVDDRVSYHRQRPVANEHYLVDALNALLAGEPAPQAQVEVAGCLINFPQRDTRVQHAEISYSTQIAPLLEQHCVACHRPGGIGPFALQDYNMVRGFAPMIREVVRTQRMPPWHADPHVGQFANDRSMSVAERQLLVHWIEAGAPRGDGPDPLPSAMQRGWPDWALGEPDLIIELPAFDVPATGVIPYQHPRIANPLSEERWIRAVDFIPGDRTVVHHIIATLAGQEGGELRRGILGAGLGGYVPGGGPTQYPLDTGVRLRPGAEFILQMHYTTSGRATRDVTRMGLYFADAPPQHELQSMTLINPFLRIPPYARAHQEQASRQFTREVEVYSLLPHAHFRGRSTGFKAIYPDGTEEMLLWVPNYDFNWQHTYELKAPKRLPAGTTLVHTTVWDNSPQNRANPDPSVEVRWGLQSWEEMLFGSVRYRYLEPAD